MVELCHKNSSVPLCPPGNAVLLSVAGVNGAQPDCVPAMLPPFVGLLQDVVVKLT